METCADLEISLHRRDNYYTVEMRFSYPDSATESRLPLNAPAVVQFNKQDLQRHILTHDPHGYGAALSASLFADPAVRSLFDQARRTADQHQVPLRVRLLIDGNLPELHSMRWETLCDPQGERLLTSERTLFSRYLNSDDARPIRLRPVCDLKKLKVLVAIANPSDLERYKPDGQRLTPFDVRAEKERIHASLGDMNIIPLKDGEPITLHAISTHLREGSDIVYLLAHGAFTQGKPYLWLQDAQGTAAVVEATELAHCIRELTQPPRLVVLASCQSGFFDQSKREAIGSNQYTIPDGQPPHLAYALGPLLAMAGVPAVVAMQGDISLSTLEQFIPTFFKVLFPEGQIDRAMAIARSQVRDAPDWWMPVLFTRLRDGRLWDTSGIPRRVPTPPQHYVRRQQAERELRDNLLQHTSNTHPVTMLCGLSGTGKSSLAAQVVQDLLQEHAFPAGVLWGDLANHTPPEQIWHFLAEMQEHKDYSVAARYKLLKDAFWQQHVVNKRILIVLDNVQDGRQLAEILPTSPAGKYRVLVISIQELPELALQPRKQHLSVFGEAEARLVFERLLPAQQVAAYQEQLREIAQRLAHLPHLITTAALDFASNRVLPTAYLHRLRQSDEQARLLGTTDREGLELAVQALTPEQQRLFAFIGVFGDGDWSARMLAAVALRPLREVQQALAVLTKQGLVDVTAGNRYSINTYIRHFVRQQLAAADPYTVRAAATLLARYCLDVVQDLGAALAARPELRITPGESMRKSDVQFVQAFRAGVLPEMSHVRQVLTWAEKQEAWNLLLRFSYVPHAELLKRLFAYVPDLQLRLCMATLEEPLICVREQQYQPELAWEAAVLASELTMREQMVQRLLDESRSDKRLIHAEPFDLHIGSPHNTPHCDIELDILAGSIIDGIFDSIRLNYAQWVGTRAPYLILHQVHIIGSTFSGCDLSHSTWVGGDAQRVMMPSCNLSYSLFKGAKLHRAVLRGSNLTGAILEQVDLSQADLREVNFMGAMLTDVNLEGADLRQADFTAAQLHGCKLTDCWIEDTRWPAESLDASNDDTAIRTEINHEIATRQHIGTEQLPQRVSEPLWATRMDIEGGENRHFAGADLRATQLSGVDHSNFYLEGANLCLANLAGAKLERAILTRALLRATILTNARLEEADLSYANLRAAQMNNAYLKGAILTHANLSRTDLRGADLGGANLYGADLSEADLSEADLRAARLQGAICTRVNFRNAQVDDQQLSETEDLGGAILSSFRLTKKFHNNNFAGCDLTRAQLSGEFYRGSLAGANLSQARLSGMFIMVDFTGANFQGADLSQAVLQEANFTHALNLTDEQLRTASQLRGATMPDGNRYDGRFNLAGDLAAARKRNVNIDDKNAMRIFYGISSY